MCEKNKTCAAKVEPFVVGTVAGFKPFQLERPKQVGAQAVRKFKAQVGCRVRNGECPYGLADDVATGIRTAIAARNQV